MRQDAYHKQNGKCFYCDFDMYEKTLEDHIEFDKRLGIYDQIGRYRRRVRKFRRCTIEHLLKAADGGFIQVDNIVAACSQCNSIRKDRTVEEHKAYIQSLLNSPYNIPFLYVEKHNSSQMQWMQIMKRSLRKNEKVV